MVEISLFWVVLILVVIHTILQHLINWGFRSIKSQDDESVIPLSILTFSEVFLLVLSLYLLL